MKYVISVSILHQKKSSISFAKLKNTSIVIDANETKCIENNEIPIVV